MVDRRLSIVHYQFNVPAAFGQPDGCILFQNLYNKISSHLVKIGDIREDKMSRESKVEIEVRETIANCLGPNEILREYTWGSKEGSMSSAYFLFGALGAALMGQNQSGFFVGLTDKRLMLLVVNGRVPTGEVHSILLGDIKGLQYRSSGTAGFLNVHLSADVLRLIFDKRPWWGRAKNMAKLMPLPA
jgi:hypothetical protein